MFISHFLNKHFFNQPLDFQLVRSVSSFFCIPCLHKNFIKINVCFSSICIYSLSKEFFMGTIKKYTYLVIYLQEVFLCLLFFFILLFFIFTQKKRYRYTQIYAVNIHNMVEYSVYLFIYESI